MLGRASRLNARKLSKNRNYVMRTEWLEPRTMMSGIGVLASAIATTNTAPTVAHSITVGGGTTVTGTTASLSVLGSDAQGAAHLLYDWSVSSAPAGGAATFSINDTNAAQNTALKFTKAGTYEVSVKIVDAGGLSVTNSMAVNVTASFTSIKISTVANTVVSSATPLQVLGVSQTLVGQGLDQFGNALATQPTFKWSTASAPSGAPAPSLTASGASATFTFGKAGSYVESVQATVGGVSHSGTASLLVVAKPSSITVAQVGGAAQVTGTTAQFSVTPFQDQFHANISETSKVTWTATTAPSGAGAPTFVTSGAITTVAFKAAGQYVLKATETDSAGNAISESVTVTVAQQAAGATSPSTSSLTVTGTSAQLNNPTIVDQFGKALATQPALVWTATTLPSGAAAPTITTVGGVSTVTFATAGAYKFTARVAGPAGISFVETATVTQTLTSIVVTPGTASLAAGATQQFAAQAVDQFYHAMQTQPAISWSASGGTISSGGLFTAPSSAASYTISAHGQSVAGTATVSVQASSGNLQNSFLNQLIQSLDSDGSISRNDMLQILDAVAAKGAVTASELSDLKTIVNEATTLDMAGYVQVLASDVVNGNLANATYQGSSLGNLAVGSSATQLDDLVDKWFLGTDLPTLTDSSLIYQTVSGSLFPTTPAHTGEFQGELGDCYFISSLGTIADKDPAAIEDMFVNNGDGTYTVRFYDGTYGASYNSNGTYNDGFTSGTGKADYVTVNLSLPTTTSGMLVYADYGASKSNAGNALWIPLLEKAYAQWNQTGNEGRNGQNSYSAIEGGWMATVDAQVLGHNATDYMMTNATEQQLISALSSGQAVTIGTINDEYGLYGSHAYAVTGYNASSNTFTLYNPWGFDQPGQLTWSQLVSDCTGFTAVNAAGATPISGAVVKSAVAGGMSSDAPQTESTAAPAEQAVVAAIELLLDRGSFSAPSDSSADFDQSVAGDELASAVAANSANVTIGRASAAAAYSGAASFDDGAHVSLASLSDGSSVGVSLDQSLTAIGLFFAEFGADGAA
jgi:hypothetical protein